MPQVSRSVRGMVALRTAVLHVMDLEARLERANAEVKRLQEVELPTAFTEDGVSELRLPDGLKAKRVTDIQGSLPSAALHPVERENAILWLAENGYVDLIRTTVAADFDRGNNPAAVELFNQLRQLNNAHVTKKEDVHHSTLRAMIRQRIEANQETPIEELGCTIIRRVKLTTPPRVSAATERTEDLISELTRTQSEIRNA